MLFVSFSVSDGVHPNRMGNGFFMLPAPTVMQEVKDIQKEIEDTEPGITATILNWKVL